PDLPAVRRESQVTYDAASGNIVVYGGRGPDAKGKHSSAGRNDVFLWHVGTGGAWRDITSIARMPAMRQPAGAVDAAGWHCYRPGRLYTAAGKSISGADNAKAWCMKLDFSGR